MSSNIDLSNIAKRCHGMSGADLENILNEAAILTARKKSKEITLDSIDEAIYRMQTGLLKKSVVPSDKTKQLAAIY